jgi:DNA-directed RNA polymerase subunit beta'
MRTFHIGGIAQNSGADASSHENRGEGQVKYENLQVVKRQDGVFVALNRQGELKIVDGLGRERETYPVVYGARLKVADGETVKPGTTLVEWESSAKPILTEVAGTVKYGDLIDGVTIQEQVDHETGMSQKTVIESKDPTARPRMSIKDDEGATISLPEGRGMARYLLPRDAILTVEDGTKVYPGDELGRVIREAARTKDITGGLPRVAELFEARKPKDFAVISEVDGSVSFGADTKGKRKVVVTPEIGDAREYLIAKSKNIIVTEGDFVRAGEALMDGAANPHDILRVLGEKALAKYLVDEIQEVY